MNFKEKILLVFSFIFFISVIASLIFRNSAFILFAILMGVFLFYIYLYNEDIKKNTKETLDFQNRDIIETQICVKPSKDNPFMNPNIIDKSNLNYKSCKISNNKIKDKINKFFKEPVFKDVRDIYDRKFSERQFYTIPATTIPNDQEGFSKWLYYREKTCKENNGERCYYNIM